MYGSHLLSQKLPFLCMVYLSPTKLGEIPKAVHRSNDSNSTTMDDLGEKMGVPVISHGFLEFLKWQEQLESVAKALLAGGRERTPWVQW